MYGVGGQSTEGDLWAVFEEGCLGSSGRNFRRYENLHDGGSLGRGRCSADSVETRRPGDPDNGIAGTLPAAAAPTAPAAPAAPTASAAQGNADWANSEDADRVAPVNGIVGSEAGVVTRVRS
jgi:hypothetical protein